MNNRLKAVSAVALVAVALVAYFVVDASYESCGEWHERYQRALTNSISWTGEDRSVEDMALAIVESERPEGCS